MANKIIHKHSNVVNTTTVDNIEVNSPKLPEASGLTFGEIAINYAKGYETISIKNVDNEIIEFKSKEYVDKQDNEVLDIVAANFDKLESDLNTIIIDNEEVISQSLCELKDGLEIIENELNQSISTGTEINDTTEQLVEGKAVYEYVTNEVGKIKNTAATHESYGLVKLGTNTLSGNVHPVGVIYNDELYFGISDEFENYSGSLKLKDHHNITWGENSNMNDLKTAGVYDIYGQRLSLNDNMPINNSNPGHSISAKLFVIDSSLKPDNGSVPTEICVTQFLQLSNRLGGDGASYIRTYNENNGNGKWSPWQKQQGIIETYINSNNWAINVDNTQNTILPGLNSMIDNGMYSGIYTDDNYLDGRPTFLETFVLVVINDYAAASKLNGVRTVSQLKYSTDTINPGTTTIKKRVGIGNDEITWGEWDSIAMQSNIAELDGKVELYNELTQSELETLNNNVSANTKSISELQNKCSDSFEVVAQSLNDLQNEVSENAEVIAKTLVKINSDVEHITNNITYPIIYHSETSQTSELTPNEFHIWNTVDELTLTLGSGIEGHLNEHFFQFTSTDETILSLPSDIKWIEMPIMANNKIHQISIINNLATVLSFDI